MAYHHLLLVFAVLFVGSWAQRPDPVTNVKLQTLSSTSIHVEWDAPSDATDITAYEVNYHEEGDQQWNYIMLQSTRTEYTMTGLKPFTTYFVRITAKSQRGEAVNPMVVSSRTYSDRPVGVPVNVEVRSVNFTSLLVVFDPPPRGTWNGILTGYKIRYTRKHSRRTKSVTTDLSRRCVLTGIAAGTDYYIRVSALNVNGSGPTSPYVVGSTQKPVTIPGQPSAFWARPAKTSITLAWAAPQPNENIDGYHLAYGIGTPDQFALTIGPDQRAHVLENLRPSTDYVMSLRAFNSAGDGRAVYEIVKTLAETASEPTAPMTPPIGVRAIVLSTSTILVTWTDLSLGRDQRITDNRFYTVRYSAENSHRFYYLNSTDLTAQITGLTPNQEYEFSVRTTKGQRRSTWSISVSNKTFATTHRRKRDISGEEGIWCMVVSSIETSRLTATSRGDAKQQCAAKAPSNLITIWSDSGNTYYCYKYPEECPSRGFIKYSFYRDGVYDGTKLCGYQQQEDLNELVSRPDECVPLAADGDDYVVKEALYDNWSRCLVYRGGCRRPVEIFTYFEG